jgi:hypothetical protein
MIINSRNFMIVAMVMLHGAVSTAAEGDKPLRWSFAEGQAFLYQVVQDVELELTVGSTTTKTTVHQTIDLAWTVGEVNGETNDAQMTQKITRMQLSLDSPATGKVEFDSDSKADLEGVGKLLSPVLSALVGSKVKFRMSPRGDINEVQQPADVLAALKNVPGAKLLGGMFNQESFRNMIKQASMVLPEKVESKGWKYTQPHVIKNDLLGKMTADTTYTYEGSEKVDARDLAKFGVTLKLAFDEEVEKRIAKISIKDQKSSGALYFDATKGRLDHCEVHQDLKLEITIAGQKVQQHITSTTKLNVKE